MRNEVIEAYVTDVLRRLPGKDRTGIGFELRGLLNDMLAERERPDDDATVLAMLREFGTPAEVADRYRQPGLAIIPAAESRTFARWAIGGVLLQWALTLPQVFGGDLRAVTWWFTWGLGSLWWPGFLVMASLAAAWLRHRGFFKPAEWSPRVYDPERVNRKALGFGLFGIVSGAALMATMPWWAPQLPGVLPRVLAFDPGFLSQRAWPALVLWVVTIALHAYILHRGRWSTVTRHVGIVSSVLFVGLMGWWIASGPIFVAAPTDAGAKGALLLVAAITLLSLLAEVWRERIRIRTPRADRPA